MISFPDIVLSTGWWIHGVLHLSPIGGHESEMHLQ